MSHEYTVFLIFGVPELLYQYWAPIFANKLGGSKIEYKIQKSLFTVVRSSRRDKFTHNFMSWHSMCEYALTVVRMPYAVREKGSSTTKKNAATKNAPVKSRPHIFNYNEEFKKKYGSLNGNPSNVYLNYEPPVARQRLRDGENKELRQNAEKSIVLNEYCVDLFVPQYGLVWDMFAGSASMALACIKNKRRYIGTELNEEVVIWAQQRIGRAWAVDFRNELVDKIAGLPRSLSEQVIVVFVVCVCA